MIRQNATLYFCDEAGVGDPNAALGGLAISLQDAIEVERRLKAIRLNAGVTGEIKWSNAKRRRDSLHRSYARLLRELHDEGKADLHLIFIPMPRYMHRISGERGKVNTISKQYYNLILYRAVRYYGAASLVHIRLDNGEFTEKLPRFHENLNARAAEKFDYINPIATIKCRDSCSAQFIQFLDVTLGALAALRNGRYSGRPPSFKAELAEEIWKLWGEIDLSANSPISNRGFNIWNVSPTL